LQRVTCNGPIAYFVKEVGENSSYSTAIDFNINHLIYAAHTNA